MMSKKAPWDVKPSDELGLNLWEGEEEEEEAAIAKCMGCNVMPRKPGLVLCALCLDPECDPVFVALKKDIEEECSKGKGNTYLTPKIRWNREHMLQKAYPPPKHKDTEQGIYVYHKNHAPQFSFTCWWEK